MIRKLLGSAVGAFVLLFRFIVPQNLWDMIEASRLVREAGLSPPAASAAIQWILIAVGLAIIVFANRDSIKEEVVEKILNPIVPLPDAALRARKKLRGTHWQAIAEGWADNFDEAQSSFATYIATIAPILVKRPQSLDFEPMSKKALGIGRITDGGSRLVAHGGGLVYSELAIRARDLRAAIRGMREDDDPGIRENIARLKGPQ